ncbi:Uncharacterised protein [Moraxella lacunata]|uniref:Uncharacterized protein n=1 Tax=Moraxella lacunata TaxID=477 RepID=A0A378TTX4_MORLA|nr:hypothetical protein [Moraxella lacunata]STZ64305.1 Uncharacterised protein [Moraxella lacunata]
MNDLSNAYYEVLDDLLYTYFAFCRDFRSEEKNHLEIIYILDDDFVSMEHHPLELLIHYTGILSLCSSWHPDASNYFLGKINEIISNHNINDLLSLLNEGYYEFKRDLKSFNIIS